MRTTKLVTVACMAVVFALGVFALASQTQAGKPWHSVTAARDFTGECSTTAAATAVAAAPGGVSCFSTTNFVPGSANMLRIIWSTTGDTHGGAALQLGCVITSSLGTVFCNPAGTGAAPGTYITKNKLPVPSAASNCNDGGGGDADCHDNSVNQIWCVPIAGDDTFTIDLYIASSDPGGAGADFVFVEAQTFFVDSTKITDGNICGDV